MRILKFVPSLVVFILLGYIVIAQTTNSESPAVISAVAPTYPPIAKAARATGDVFVDVEIDRTGRVTSAHAINSNKLLQRVSEEAARRWQFMPAADGEKKRKAKLTFTFKILSDKESAFPSVFYPPYKIEVRSPEVIVQQVTTPE